MGLRDFQIIAICFYLHFIHNLKFCSLKWSCTKKQKDTHTAKEIETKGKTKHERKRFQILWLIMGLI